MNLGSAFTFGFQKPSAHLTVKKGSMSSDKCVLPGRGRRSSTAQRKSHCESTYQPPPVPEDEANNNSSRGVLTTKEVECSFSRRPRNRNVKGLRGDEPMKVTTLSLEHAIVDTVTSGCVANSRVERILAVMLPAVNGQSQD